MDQNVSPLLIFSFRPKFRVDAPVGRKIACTILDTMKGSSLQATWNTNRGATKQWNSRQRRKFLIFHGLTLHQLEYFMKFSKSQFSRNHKRSSPTRTLTLSLSVLNKSSGDHGSNQINPWCFNSKLTKRYRNPSDRTKVMNQNVSPLLIFFFSSKITLRHPGEGKYCLHDPRYNEGIVSTSHLEYEPRRREAMKFAPAKKIFRFSLPNPSPASIFHQIFQHLHFPEI